MTIQVYSYNEQEEKELLEFLKSKHYHYKEAVEDEAEQPDAEFLEQYNRELDEADAQIDAGEYYTHDEVKEYFAARRKRLSGN